MDGDEISTLTGGDYFSKPALELQSHPDYNPFVFALISQIKVMKTKDLEKLNIIQDLIPKRSVN